MMEMPLDGAKYGWLLNLQTLMIAKEKNYYFQIWLVCFGCHKKVQEYLPGSTKNADLSKPGLSGPGDKASPILSDQLNLYQPGGS